MYVELGEGELEWRGWMDGGGEEEEEVTSCAGRFKMVSIEFTEIILCCSHVPVLRSSPL